MAIIWQKTTKNTQYEVRTAGNTVRLYTDGVFHSHYNPKHIVTRNVWDLLVMPALMYPEGSIKRVLLLGVGGGAAIHMLNYFIKPETIVGIELNPIHLQVAKRFFNVDYENTILKKADAIEWVKTYKGKPFDMIIDDLYGENNGEPERAIAADNEWFLSLNNLMNDKSVLITNFVTAKEFRTCGFFTNENVQRKFSCAYKLTTRLYHNHIGAFFKNEQNVRMLRKNLNNHKITANKDFGKSFNVTKIPF